MTGKMYKRKSLRAYFVLVTCWAFLATFFSIVSFFRQIGWESEVSRYAISKGVLRANSSFTQRDIKFLKFGDANKAAIEFEGLSNVPVEILQIPSVRFPFRKANLFSTSKYVEAYNREMARLIKSTDANLDIHEKR